MRRRDKSLEDFLNGTFTGGGIFDEPLKVKLGKLDAGPSFDFILKQILGEDRKDNVKETTAVGLTAKKKETIKKLEALAADPGATEGERNSARAAIQRVRGVGNE